MGLDLTTSPLKLASRRTGRGLSALAGLCSLGIAIYTAVSQSDRVLRLYDGLWMVAGAVAVLGIVAPIIWRWPRERALLALAFAVTAGAWLPIVILAWRAGMPVVNRIRGAIFWTGADIIGLTLPIGVLFLWLALQEHRPTAASMPGPEA